VLGGSVIFSIMIFPLLAPSNENFEKIATALPNYNLILVLEKIMIGEGYVNLTYRPFVIVAWVVF
jgi:hypothetical protein